MANRKPRLRPGDPTDPCQPDQPREHGEQGQATQAMPHGSDCTTEGIRVEAQPQFLPTYSDSEAGRFVFGYRVRISNQGETRVRVTRRYWTIVDADGESHVVDQPGIVGQTPFLEPGTMFEYASFCPLPTEWGTMEGHYLVEREGAEPVRALIGRFFLVRTEQ